MFEKSLVLLWQLVKWRPCLAVGIAANALAVAMWLPYLFVANGTGIRPMLEAVFLVFLCGACLVLGLSLSAVELYVRRSWWVAAASVVLSLSPFPVSLIVFDFVCWIKQLELKP